MTNKTYYQVNLIRSRRAVEREKLDAREHDQHIGNYDTLEEAQAIYAQQSTGTEVDKELVKVTEDANGYTLSTDIIEDTY